MKNQQFAEHWNNKYNTTNTKKLGWYEENPEPSLTLIKESPIDKNDLVVDIGCGTSTLVDELLVSGYTNIVLSDISQSALSISRNRLQKKFYKLIGNITFLTDDITNSKYIKNLNNIAIWHDRAVLHFLIDEKDQQSYLDLLKSTVKKGGYIIISTFAIGKVDGVDGIKKCSGLPIKQYSVKTLSEFLGSEFKLVESFDYTYTTTWGQKRPFIYAKFKLQD